MTNNRFTDVIFKMVLRNKKTIFVMVSQLSCILCPDDTELMTEFTTHFQNVLSCFSDYNDTWKFKINADTT